MNHDLPQRFPGLARIPLPRYPTTLPSAALLIRVAAGTDNWSEDDRMNTPGSGRRQQSILRLLSDGAPRSCEFIASELALSADVVHGAIKGMSTRRWLQEIGHARSWLTRVWRITPEGRQIIRPEYIPRPSGRRGKRMLRSEMTQTPRLQQILTDAAAAAARRGHSHVGVEHVALAILADPSAVPTQVMRRMGLDLEDIGAEITTAMGLHGYTTPTMRAARLGGTDG